MSPIKAVFHWKYSGVLIFFFYALAFAMIGIGTAVEPFEELFNFAYLFLFIAAFWAVGWWLTSDALEKKKPKLTKKQKKHNEKVSLVPYRAWQWIPTILIALALAVSLKLAGRIELARELSLNHGWLVAADDPDPASNPCNPMFTPKDALKIHLGQMMAFSTFFPYTILAVDGKKEVWVDRDDKGRVAISLDIRSEDEKIIATIERGHFTVNQNNSLDMQHPDRSTLSVRDEYKGKVLDIRYKNKRNLELSAILQYPHGKVVTISKDVTPVNCIGNVGSIAINVVTH